MLLLWPCSFGLDIAPLVGKGEINLLWLKGITSIYNMVPPSLCQAPECQVLGRVDPQKRRKNLQSAHHILGSSLGPMSANLLV